MEEWTSAVGWWTTGLCLLLAFGTIAWRAVLTWWPRRIWHWRERTAAKRPLSSSEAMLLNFKECNRRGVLNMAMLLHLSPSSSSSPSVTEPRLKRALSLLQRRHAVLRSVVDAESRTVSLVSPAPSLPVVIDSPSSSSSQTLSDALLLEEELNTCFSPALLRCRLVPGCTASAIPQRLVITIDHILLDGPSLGLLTKELLSLLHSPTLDLDFDSNASVPITIHPSSSSSSSLSSSLSHSSYDSFPLPTSSDLWLPSLPSALLMVYALGEFLLRSRFMLPRIRFLPLTNPSPPPPVSSQQHGSWATLLELRTLDADSSSLLFRRCREHSTTLGALLACVACACVARQAAKAENGDASGRVWLHMTVDMRRLADSVMPGLREEPVGHHAVFLIDTSMPVRDLLSSSSRPADFWRLARHQRDEFASNFTTRHRHLANHVIAGSTAGFQKDLLVTYCRTKQQPKGGTVSLSNLGLVTPPPPDPSSSPSASLLASAGLRGYLFPSADAMQGLGVLDVRGAVSQSMPTRHVCITSMTMDGTLRLSFSYADFSVSRHGAAEYADDFVALLRSLISW